jgi:photosystem II stability/assembly factor-like uncharacterized protein
MNVLTLLAALTAIVPSGWQEAPCWVADAAAQGERLWMLCDHHRVFFREGEGAWQESRVPAAARLRSLAIGAQGRVFVAGDDATLLVSEDAGSSWRRVAVPTGEHLRAMHFTGSKGWIAGWGGVILHSSDNGDTWTAQRTGTTVSLESIFFIDEEHGWSAGWNGAILRTDDAGKNWTYVRTSAATWSLNAVYFRDPLNGWAVGILGQLLRSQDGGKTWVKQDVPTRSAFQSIYFDGAGRGYVMGGDIMLFSEDGGDNWTLREIGARRFLERVLPYRQGLWAVGPSGMLLLERAGPPKIS